MRRIVSIAAALALLLLPALPARADNIRTISTADGLTNNVIYSICQDSFGNLWLGTADGLNIWNGHSMQVFRSAEGVDYFAGNTIRKLVPAEPDIVWVQSDFGLARIDTRTRESRFFQDFNYVYELVSNTRGTTFLLDSHGQLFFYERQTGEMVLAGQQFQLTEASGCHISLDEQDHLYVFTPKGIFRYDAAVGVASRQTLFSSEWSSSAGVSVPLTLKDGLGYFVNHLNVLSTFNTATGETAAVCDLGGSISAHGRLTGIVPGRDGIYMVFRDKTLQFLANGESSLREPLPGQNVLCVFQDGRQHIVWVGTDAKGLKRWSKSSLSFDEIPYSALPYHIMTPVRALLFDAQGDLWFGTKGDGIFRISGYKPGSKYDKSNTKIYTKATAGLSGNEVNVFCKSRRPLFWVGGYDPGIDYYSYADKRFHTLEGSGSVSRIHAFVELNDTTLWAASADGHAYRLTIKGSGAHPQLSEVVQVDLPSTHSVGNKLYSMVNEGDSVLWMGSRGSGVSRHNTRTGISRQISFPLDLGFSANEVYALGRTESMLFATGCGLIFYDQQSGRTFKSSKLPSRTIHGVLVGSDDDIWLSTNRGIIRYDEEQDRSTTFDANYGLELLEFSDGATYADIPGRNYFFGGIDGILAIHQGAPTREESVIFRPPINILGCSIDGQPMTREKRIGGGKLLKIPRSRSPLVVDFSVVDNLNYADYQFSYRTDSGDSTWVDIGNTDRLYVPPMRRGRHSVTLRYINKAQALVSGSTTIHLKVIPPAYTRWWAWTVYSLLLLSSLFTLYRRARKRYSEMKERIRRQYEEELRDKSSEAVYRITDELSVLVTFIQGVCRQIWEEAPDDEGMKPKVEAIEYNVSRISKLIYLFNEFLSLKEHKSQEVALVGVSQMASEIITLMQSRIAGSGITLVPMVQEGIVWPTYRNSVLTLFNVLFTQAVKVSRPGTRITPFLNQDGDTLVFGMRGYGDIAHYRSVEHNLSSKRIIEQTAISQADNLESLICINVVADMKGTISASWQEESDTMTMTVRIPKLDLSGISSAQGAGEIGHDYWANGAGMLPLSENVRPDYRLESLLLVSASPDIQNFVSYFFRSRFNVYFCVDTLDSLELLKKLTPAIIIYDVSPGTGRFASFVGKIRENPLCSQIPIIALSPSLQYAQRTECIRLGADFCIAFPFNMEYLLAGIEHLLEKKSEQLDYYKSALSAYSARDGKLIHAEDKALLGKIMKIVDGNIAGGGPRLTVPFIASELGMSTRVLYKKLQEVPGFNLPRFIKDTRLSNAARLLATSKMSIDEILYSVGYDNRSTFFKNFRDTYGLTPKEYREAALRKNTRT